MHSFDFDAHRPTASLDGTPLFERERLRGRHFRNASLGLLITNRLYP